MNIIFLDIDGVLNSKRKLIEIYNKTHKSHSGYNYPFDEKCLEYLKLLVEKTNSKIVITSSWRKTKEGIILLNKTLKEYNLDKYIIGYTPILNTKREIEIIEYLKTLKEIPNYIILDDDIKDLESLSSYLIKTDKFYGLTYKNITKGIKILSKKRI